MKDMLDKKDWPDMHECRRFLFTREVVDAVLAANNENRTLNDTECAAIMEDISTGRFHPLARTINLMPSADGTGYVLAGGQTRLTAVKRSGYPVFEFNVYVIERDERRYDNDGIKDSLGDKRRQGLLESNPTALERQLAVTYNRQCIVKQRRFVVTQDWKLDEITTKFRPLYDVVHPSKHYDKLAGASLPQGMLVYLMSVWDGDRSLQGSIVEFVNEVGTQRSKNGGLPSIVTEAFSEQLAKIMNNPNDPESYGRTARIFEATKYAWGLWSNGFNGKLAKSKNPAKAIRSSLRGLLRKKGAKA